MLKTRILSGIIGVPLLFAIAYTGKTAFGIGVSILTLLALHELFFSLEGKGVHSIRVIRYLSFLPVLFLALKPVMFGKNDADMQEFGKYMSMIIFFVLFFLFCILIFYNRRYNFLDVAVTAFGSLYICFLFSFLILTRNEANGAVYIWLIFMGWVSDTFAYLIGRKFGKHKLIPAVSANKTVEGAIGGLVGCILSTSAYGILVNLYFQRLFFTAGNLILLGVLIGLLSQMGDLAASSIKRFAGVKDFGSIIPGHGGILDRFDSVLFVAPVVYFYTSILLGG